MSTDTDGIEALAAAQDEKKKEKQPKQAEVLVRLATAATLFRTVDYVAYADIEIGGHRETWPVKSPGFRRWLRHQYYETQEEHSPSAEALKDAIEQIDARAHCAPGIPTREVYIRVANADGKIYVDMCNDAWEAVEISAAGWQVIKSPPVRFRRAKGMLPLPTPNGGGSLTELLRPFLNVKTDDDLLLIEAWLAGALRGLGPYVILALLGQQGTAKSTLLKVLRRLIDPNVADLRAPPKNEHDVVISCKNSHILAFDNLRDIQDWLSDCLCRVATGAGFSTRKLYEDDEEALFTYCKPSLLNGIENVIMRGDLGDRSVFLTLVPIPDMNRKEEAEFWKKFEAVQPDITGALFDTIVHGLANFAATKLNRLPRMADFARWATSCLGYHFLEVYEANRQAAHTELVDNNLFAATIAAYFSELKLKDTEEWQGSATDLLALFEEAKDGREPIVSEAKRKSKAWPSERKVRGYLRQHAPNLYALGIVVDPDGPKDPKTRRQLIRITPKVGGETSFDASHPSEHSEFRQSTNGLGPVGGAKDAAKDNLGSQASFADGPKDASMGSPSSAHPSQHPSQPNHRKENGFSQCPDNAKDAKDNSPPTLGGHRVSGQEDLAPAEDGGPIDWDLATSSDDAPSTVPNENWHGWDRIDEPCAVCGKDINPIQYREAYHDGRLVCVHAGKCLLALTDGGDTKTNGHTNGGGRVCAHCRKPLEPNEPLTLTTGPDGCKVVIHTRCVRDYTVAKKATAQVAANAAGQEKDEAYE